MRIVAIVMLAGALAGCASAQSGFTTAVTAVDTVVADVQKLSQNLCQFVPTAATITAIVTHSPTALANTTIASNVCKAIAPQASGPGASKTPGYVRSGSRLIKVEGKFVYR